MCSPRFKTPSFNLASESRVQLALDHASDETRRLRLAELRAQLQAGTYRPDPKQIARAVQASGDVS